MTGWASGVAVLAAALAALTTTAAAPAAPAAAPAAPRAAPGASAEDARGRVLVAFADRAITESSGLVDAGTVLHTVNDSGSAPEVFTVDTSTGRTAAVTRYRSGEVEDVEALAPGPSGSVWVADIGDNAGARESVTVYRVRPRSDVPAPRFVLTYPDGPRDAETLLAHPRSGRLFVVSKSVFGGTVYAAPRRLTPGRTHRLAEFARVPGLLTDGAFLPDGRHVLLRGYASAALYTFPGFALVGRFDLPRQRQGEGLAVGADGRILLSSEGVGAEVLSVRLPARLARAAVGTAPDGGGPSALPSPPPGRPAGAETGVDTGADSGAGAGLGWWAAAVGVLAGLALVLALIRLRRDRT